MGGDIARRPAACKSLRDADSLGLDLNRVLDAASVAARQCERDGYVPGSSFLKKRPVAFFEAFGRERRA